jgi:hypothetical protein
MLDYAPEMINWYFAEPEKLGGVVHYNGSRHGSAVTFGANRTAVSKLPFHSGAESEDWLEWRSEIFAALEIQGKSRIYNC